MRRAKAKLRISCTGVDYFANNNVIRENTAALAIEFYFGVYLSGLIEGTEIKDAELAGELRREIEDTKNIFSCSKKIKNRKYKVISFIYKIFGISAIDMIIKLYKKIH